MSVWCGVSDMRECLIYASECAVRMSDMRECMVCVSECMVCVSDIYV